MDKDGFFPLLYNGTCDGGRFEPDLNPGTEYYVDDPLKVFEALARAGNGYALRVNEPERQWQGAVLAAQNRNNNDARLLRFIRDYGLPVERTSGPAYMKYRRGPWGSSDVPEVGHCDIGKGAVGGDMRTSAALANLCWTLWGLIREMEKGDQEARSKAIAVLRKRLRSFDGDPDFPHSEGEKFWTFLPTNRSRSVYWCLFALPEATSEEVLLRQGVYRTCSQIAQWYLASSIQIDLASLNGEASPPQLVVRTRELLSYLWLHFISAVTGRGIPKFYPVQCRQEHGTNGCGRWFYSDSPKAVRCPDCDRLINRIEQRIKRHPELKQRKDQLIEEERSRKSQA